MITYHDKIEHYATIADRPAASNYGVGQCLVANVTYVSDGAAWTSETAAAITAPLEGFSASAGTVGATDSILAAFNKLVANVALKATNLLTGFVSGAGTVAATDTVLQAINKLDGNVALKADASTVSVTYTTITSITITNGVVTAIVGS
jgi:hypothetical protein